MIRRCVIRVCMIRCSCLRGGCRACLAWRGVDILDPVVERLDQHVQNGFTPTERVEASSADQSH